MNKIESKEFTHILYTDSFPLENKGNDEVTLIRKGLYKPKHIIFSGFMALLMQCVFLPFLALLGWTAITGQPAGEGSGTLIPFSMMWWFLAIIIPLIYCGILYMLWQFLQLLFLPYYTHKYDISIGSICSQKKNLFSSRTKNIELDKNIRLEVKFDLNFKEKYLIYPTGDENFIQSYSKEFSVWIYRNNLFVCEIDSLFQEELDLFLNVVQRNNEIQIQNSQLETDTTTPCVNNNDHNEINDQVAPQELQVAAMGVFDVCRFVLTWIILWHVIFLPQTIFYQSWTQQRLDKVLRNHYTDEEIKSQNIHYVETQHKLLLSNGTELSNKDYNYVHGYWIYLIFGVLAIVIILDVIFGKRNITFVKWFLEEFNKPLKYQNLYVRKWQLKSAYKRNRTNIQ
ncbi:MAG: hypothetical protein LBK06_06410 [Planctomycetaceae bacterium]|nr:hypothetical protein [Planctomycetaceae bacterium]